MIQKIKSFAKFLFMSRKGNQIIVISVLSFGALFLAVYYIGNLRLTGSFAPCSLKRMTGLSCAGCGATRATDLLLRGRLWDAFKFNPAYILLLIEFARLGFIFSRNAFAGEYRVPSAEKIRSGRVVGICIAILAFTVFRNLPFYPESFY